MATLPYAAHGDTFSVVKISPAYEGSGDSRRVIGSKLDALLLFDHCARAPITVHGLDPATLPSPEAVTERNMNQDFLKVRFQNLLVTFTGGDFGAIRYKGTASGAEFLNLAPTPTSPSK